MSTTDKRNKENSNLDDGFGQRRVRQRPGTPDYPRQKPTKSETHDSDSHAIRRDGGSLFQSASNVIIHGGNFFAFSDNANLPRAGVPNAQLNVQQVPVKGELDQMPEAKSDERHSVKSSESAAELSLVSDSGTPAPIRRSCDVYYQNLAVERRGSPLWIPEPNKNLHISYQRKGIAIGDVGIITSSGSFDFLFNICLPPGHLTNPEQLPDNYLPFNVRATDFRRYSEFKTKSCLSSASVQRLHNEGDSSNLSFETSASEGAILALPVGLNSEDLRNIRAMRKYAAANAEHWYRYIIDILGCDIRNGDVRLVTGCDKTSAWGIATFSNLAAHKRPESFHLNLRSVEQGDIGRTYEWENSSMAQVRAGPDARDLKVLRQDDPDELGAEYENQCLFVRTLNITLQDSIWKKLESELGDIEVDSGAAAYFDSLSSPQVFPTSSSASSPPSYASGYTGNQSSHFSTSPTALVGHPSEIINEMLLKHHPKARVSITEDWDWISVIQEDDFILPPLDEIYVRIMEFFSIREEEGVVYLENMEEPLQKSINADTSSVPPLDLDLAPRSLLELSPIATSAHITVIGPEIITSDEERINNKSEGQNPTSMSCFLDLTAVSSGEKSIKLYDLLDKKASAQNQPLNWKESVIDLMKVFNLNTSFEARVKLANNFGYEGDPNNYYERNVWLHKYLMKLVEENGGDLENIHTTLGCICDGTPHERPSYETKVEVEEESDSGSDPGYSCRPSIVSASAPGIKKLSSSPASSHKKRRITVSDENVSPPGITSSKAGISMLTAPSTNLKKESFPCKVEGCHRRFGRAYDRIQHEVIEHQKDRSFICPNCGMEGRCKAYRGESMWLRFQQVKAAGFQGFSGC